MVYTEQDCTVEHNGQKFEAGGAVVTGNSIVAYLGRDVLTDWHGKPIGTYKIISTWRTPRSYVYGTMRSVEALVKGVRYVGRSAGVGMVFRGKRKAGQ